MNKFTLIIDSNYVAYCAKLVDTSGFIYRGSPTNVIFGFLRTLLVTARRFETNKFIFCWDSKNLLRKKDYPEYKANRHQYKTEEKIQQDKIAYKQFDELRTRILPDLGFKRIYYKEGYESDDLIANIVMNGTDKYIIVSNDKDMYQLLDYSPVYEITHKTTMTKTLFERKYGIEPKQWAELLAIKGCDTDNVKGVFGAGEVKVVQYLKGQLNKKFKTYQDIVSPEGQAVIDRNRLLVTLPYPGLNFADSVPNELLYQSDFLGVFKRYGMQSYIDNIDNWTKVLNLIK